MFLVVSAPPRDSRNDKDQEHHSTLPSSMPQSGGVSFFLFLLQHPSSTPQTSRNQLRSIEEEIRSTHAQRIPIPDRVYPPASILLQPEIGSCRPSWAYRRPSQSHHLTSQHRNPTPIDITSTNDSTSNRPLNSQLLINFLKFFITGLSCHSCQFCHFFYSSGVWAVTFYACETQAWLS